MIGSHQKTKSRWWSFLTSINWMRGYHVFITSLLVCFLALCLPLIIIVARDYNLAQSSSTDVYDIRNATCMAVSASDSRIASTRIIAKLGRPDVLADFTIYSGKKQIFNLKSINTFEIDSSTSDLQDFLLCVLKRHESTLHLTMRHWDWLSSPIVVPRNVQLYD